MKGRIIKKGSHQILRNFSLPVFLFIFLSIPKIVNGALVKCGKSGPTECDFEDFFGLINDVVSFIIVLASSAFVIIIAIAGLRMIVTGGDPNKIKEARAMFKPAIFGFLWIIGAFLVIKFLLSFAEPWVRAGDLGFENDTIVKQTLIV